VYVNADPSFYLAGPEERPSLPVPLYNPLVTTPLPSTDYVYFRFAVFKTPYDILIKLDNEEGKTARKNNIYFLLFSNCISFSSS